ncbi:MAG: LTA synthase family protein [Lachnospiraceae bacterium]|nr:LTA synthase family protein [Lachnospiraceae bacterium]
MKGIRSKVKRKKDGKASGKPEDPVRAAAIEKRNAILNRWAAALHLAASFALCFLIEVMSRRSLSQAADFVSAQSKVYLYNSLLIFMTSLPVFLFRRRSWLRILVFTVWFGLGAVNGIVLANRVTPLTGPDLGMISEALGVISKTVSKNLIIAGAAALVLLILFVVIKFIRAKKYRGSIRYAVVIPLVAAGIGGFALLTEFFIQTKVLSTYFPNIAFAYQDYGFPYCFSVTLLDTGISQPNRYSENLVNGILNAEGITTTEAPEEKPDIIVIQLESFFDPTTVKELTFSEDPIPNWHALSEKYSSGFYTVPTVGAGTVNTEFETLTGMSLRFFGAGEYPYKSVLQEKTCESAAYILEQIGYTTHAIHNNTASFYDRVGVYPNLGFNSFTSGEYMETSADVNENGWMRDRNLIQPILDALDSSEGSDFVFSVSVQPHGTYPTESVLEDPVVTVSGAASEEMNWSWEYYVNQLYEVDQFVQTLCDRLEERGEPAVVFFYGDHLPTMGLSDDDLSRGTIYQTRYLMWDNIGLERETKTLASYQAMSEIFNRLDIRQGTMFTYHQTMKNTKNYIYNMQVLQYDILYGERYVYGRTNPFSASVLSMGVKPVSIASVRKSNENPGIYVRGSNFTPSSELVVNDETVDTTYISPNLLFVTNTELKTGDWLYVAQVSHYTTAKILSHSNTLVYGVGTLKDSA